MIFPCRVLTDSFHFLWFCKSSDLLKLISLIYLSNACLHSRIWDQDDSLLLCANTFRILGAKNSIFHTSHLFLYCSSENSHHIHNKDCNSLLFNFVILKSYQLVYRHCVFYTCWWFCCWFFFLFWSTRFRQTQLW